MRRVSRWAIAKTRANAPKALLRYFAIATAIVVLAVMIVAGYANRERLALKIQSVYVKVKPKAVTPLAQGARSADAIVGDAPWALSALPECFSQLSKSTGPLSYVLAHLPAGVAQVSEGTTLQFADCRLSVQSDQVLVRRGSDRMRIPPVTRLYRGNGLLALLRGAYGGYELRIYKAKP